MNKPFHLMRLWALLLVCLVTAAAYAQGPMVTVQVSKAPLKKVLNEVERQTPYRFSYRSKLLDGQAPVTLNVRNVTVQTLLDQVLPQRNLGYRIVSAQSIVITAKTPPHLRLRRAAPVAIQVWCAMHRASL